MVSGASWLRLEHLVLAKRGDLWCRWIVFALNFLVLSVFSLQHLKESLQENFQQMA